MPNPTQQRIAQAFSMRAARSTLHHGGQREVAMHAALLARDYQSKRDDFTGTLDTAFWTATNTGSGSASPVFNAQSGGAVRCVAGTTNPSSSVLYGTNVIYQVDDNPLLYVRFKYPAVVSSSCWLELGWTDIVSTKTTQCVSALGAQSAGATAPTVGNGLANGVTFEWNTGFTLTTPALVGVGTSISAAGVPINTAPNVPTAYSPTLSKWVDLYVGCGVGVGYCEVWENDAFIGRFSVASGPDTGTLLFPFLSFGSLGTAKTFDADVVEISAERNTR